MPATTEAAAEPNRPGAGDLKPLRTLAPPRLIPGLVVLAFLEGGLIVAQAALIATLVHAVFTGTAAAESTGPLVALLAVFVLRAGLTGVRDHLAAGASVGVRLELRNRLTATLARAAPDPQHATGRLATACIERVEAVDGFFARYLPQLVTAIVVPPILLAAVFSRDGLAGLALLITGPLIPLFMALIGLGAERLSRDHHEAMARLGGWFMDRLRGAETLRLFRAEADELRRVAGMTERLRRHAMGVLRVAFLSSAVLEFLSAVAIASLAIYIGLGLLGMFEFGPAADLDLFTGLFVLLLAPEYFQPIRALAQGWHDRADARGALAGLAPLLATPPARPAPTDPIALPTTTSLAVAFEDVTFAHPDRAPVFAKLGLDIAAGERVVLIGPSGGGKSTLLQLVAGGLSPATGRITLGGLNLDRVGEADLADHIAWLDQRPVLFPGTLAENLRLADPHAGRAELTRAADRAGVTRFARDLPDGLDTRVGEDGHGLSGGQIQRVALARTLLRPRPLLLLDEPTASLDPATEADVLDTLAEWLDEQRPTVICASHRPALLPRADRVLTVRNGRVEALP